MNLLTKTGLLPYECKSIQKRQKPQIIKFDDIVCRATLSHKRYSDFINPYHRNCSILCNHPFQGQNRRHVKSRKHWVNDEKYEGKQLEYCDDVEVPEILFRRYTDTDSRPQTPSATLTSAITKNTNKRRCITPEPTSTIREKAKLILDLRRSLSQDTVVTFNEGNDLLVTRPLVLPLHHKKELKLNKLNTRQGNHKIDNETKRKCRRLINHDDGKTMKIERKEGKILAENNNKKNSITVSQEQFLNTKALEKANILLRPKHEKIINGKEKKKNKNKLKKKKMNKNEPFSETEPKTQVCASNMGSRSSSYEAGEVNENSENASENNETSNISESYISNELLKQLQRQLDEDVVENEFDFKRRKMYEEALRQKLYYSKDTENLEKWKEQLDIEVDEIDIESILALPKTFSRRNARFELPMTCEALAGMTPMEYVESCVIVSSNSRLIHKAVFNMYISETMLQKRLLPSERFREAIGKVMGRDFTNDEYESFSTLIGWNDETSVNFRAWSGLCSLCERILGPNFTSSYPTKDEDPYDDIEIADFQLLDRRLQNQNIDQRLAEILRKIKFT